MQNTPHPPLNRTPARSRLVAAALLACLCLHTQAEDHTPTTATTSPAATLPSSQPATAPAAKSISQLINQLGDDDSDQRDLAQKKLVDRGSAAIPDLQKAADQNPDPEIRNRAAAALAQMKDLDQNGPSLITLHVKDASPAEVLSAISAQSHAVFVGVGTGLMPGPVQSITVDADRKPFWEVLADVCGQMNVGPLMQLSTRNTIQLFPSPRNWMASSPHQIVGPYWINIAGLYRTRSIDLMGPPQVQDQFIIKVMVLPEPKLAVSEMSELTVKQAADDAGNSLLSKGPFKVVLRNVRLTNHTAEALLAYPDRPGKKIAVLRGEITLMLAEGFQQFQKDDVLGAPKVIAPLPGCKVETTITRQGLDMYRVTLQCTRAGLSDDRWNAMLNHPGEISLEDSDGRPLTGFPSSMQMNTPPVQGAQPSFTTSAIFSQNSVNAMGVGVGIGPLGVRRMIKTGEAKKLTWNVATVIRPVVLPVNFKDLPMP